MSKKSQKKPLTDQQERFCLEYIVDLNATRAAIRAEYSERSASELGYQLLQNPSVKARVDTLQKERAHRLQITADMVIESLLQIAKLDLSEAYSGSGALLPIKDMPDHVRRSIAGVDVYEDIVDGQKLGETVKVKISDRVKALELLGRHLKMFTDKIQLTGKLTLEQLVTGSMKEDENDDNR